MIKFFNTPAGHKFTEKTLPELIGELNKLNKNVSSATDDFLPELKRFNDNIEQLIELKKDKGYTTRENILDRIPEPEESIEQLIALNKYPNEEE
jgi:hypothetical protein